MWEKAARGKGGERWPWGNEWRVSNLNAASSIGHTSAVGIFPLNRSHYGAYDLVGNVWELSLIHIFAVLGQRATPASLVQLWGERRGFMMSFWGLFGGVNVPMAMGVYAVLNVFLVLTIIGFAIYLARLLRAEWHVSVSYTHLDVYKRQCAKVWAWAGTTYCWATSAS